MMQPKGTRRFPLTPVLMTAPPPSIMKASSALAEAISRLTAAPPVFHWFAASWLSSQNNELGITVEGAAGSGDESHRGDSRILIVPVALDRLSRVGTVGGVALGPVDGECLAPVRPSLHHQPLGQIQQRSLSPGCVQGDTVA